MRLPEDYQRHRIRESQPDIAPELLEGTIQYMKEKRANDPLALLQPVLVDQDSELRVLRGMSLELALFVAHLTGAAVYTDEGAYWRQLHEHTSVARTVSQHAQWAPLVEKLRSFRLLIEINPPINWEARNAGKLGRMRRVFRRIWNTALTRGVGADFDENVMKLVASLEKSGTKVAFEWDTCSTTTAPSGRLGRRFELSVSYAGFSMNTVNRLLVTSGRTKYAKCVPIALFLTLDEDSR